MAATTCNLSVPGPARERELRTRTVALDEWLERWNGLDEGVTVVVIDACRSEAQALPVWQTRSDLMAGLAPTEAPRGMLIAFSTGPNSLARDLAWPAATADAGLGPYAQRFLEALREPQLALEAMFKRVHTAVEQDSQRRQRPWLSTNLIGEACLKPAPGGRPCIWQTLQK